VNSQESGLFRQPERPDYEATQLATIRNNEKSAAEPQWEEYIVDNRRVRYKIDVDVDEALGTVSDSYAETVPGISPDTAEERAFIKPWPARLKTLMTRVERAL
jgi:hypothetical protein